jgi:pilus assembly protein CpaB
MKPIRIIVLAVAAVAAIGLALIVRGVMSGKPTSQAAASIPVAKAKPMAHVLVAKRDLKIGQRLTAEDLDWQEWPVEAVSPTFITDGSVALPKAKEAPKDGKDAKDAKGPTDQTAKAGAAANATLGKLAGAAGSGKNAVDQVTHQVAMLGDGGPKAQFIGAVVRAPFIKGEPMIASKVVRSGDSGYMAVVLPAGMRAMAVGVKVETAAGGFILPGDRVDVILSKALKGSSENSLFITTTVLKNIKVLAIDQVTQPDKNENTVVGATATLEITPTDAEVLALAKAEGELSLTLRSYADVDGPSGHTGVLPRLSTVAAASRGVRVFRNGSVTNEAGTAPGTPQ